MTFLIWLEIKEWVELNCLIKYSVSLRYGKLLKFNVYFAYPVSKLNSFSCGESRTAKFFELPRIDSFEPRSGKVR